MKLCVTLEHCLARVTSLGCFLLFSVYRFQIFSVLHCALRVYNVCVHVFHLCTISFSDIYCLPCTFLYLPNFLHKLALLTKCCLQTK